jgi:hypothetical protein
MIHVIKFKWEDMIRQWCCWSDNLGEDCSPYGWGATQEEAAEDLEWQLEDLLESRGNWNDGDGVYAR